LKSDGIFSRVGSENMASIEVNCDELKGAIESQHGGTATLVQAVPVKETFEGQPVWEGVVHVFDLEGSPQATRACQVATRCCESGDRGGTSEAIVEELGAGA
jgi:hypothetical protein